MADELRIGLSELLRKAMIEQDAGFLKEGVRVLSQALMEMEVQEHVGAGRHERSAERTGQRNGYRQCRESVHAILLRCLLLALRASSLQLSGPEP